MPLTSQQLLEMFGDSEAVDQQAPAPTPTPAPIPAELPEEEPPAEPGALLEQEKTGPVSSAEIMEMFGGEPPKIEDEGTEEERGFLSNMLRQAKGGFFDFISREGTANALGDAERVQARRDGKEYSKDIAPHQFGGISQAVKTSKANVDPEFKKEYVAEAEAQLRTRVENAIANRKKGEEIPMSPETLEFLDKNSKLSIWEGFKAAPATIIADLGARSAINMVPGLALGAAGGAMAGPAGFGAGMGAGSARVEYASSFVDYLRKQGVDIDNPDAIIAAVNDKDMMNGANEHATRRAAVIGSVDAIAGLVGAKSISPFVSGKLAKELVNLPAQMVAQAGLGGAGEAGAQLATLEDLDARQIAAEAAGELVTAPVDVATAAVSGARGKAADSAAKADNQLADELDAVDTAFAKGAAEAREQGGDALDQTLAGAQDAAQSAARQADAAPLVPEGDALDAVRNQLGITTPDSAPAAPAAAPAQELSPEAQRRMAIQNVRDQLGTNTMAEMQAAKRQVAEQEAASTEAKQPFIQDVDALEKVRSQLGFEPIDRMQKAAEPIAATTKADALPTVEPVTLQSVREAQGIITLPEMQAEQEARGIQQIRAQKAAELRSSAEASVKVNEFDMQAAANAKAAAKLRAKKSGTPVVDRELDASPEPVSAMAQAMQKAKVQDEVKRTAAPAKTPVTSVTGNVKMPAFAKANMSRRRAAQAIEAQAHEAATSPTNSTPQPTQKQKEAGNYKKGHVKVAGLNITIENPAGSKREGIDQTGKKWSTEMKNHYGYIKRTKGADGDQVDVFIGDNPQSDKVFVIDQIDQKTGSFDEHKVMLGFNNPLAAARGYRNNYDKGFKVGPMKELTEPEFKSWLANSDNTKPLQPEKIKYDAGPAIPESEFQEVVQAEQRRNPGAKVRYRQEAEGLPVDASGAGTAAAPLTRKIVEQETESLRSELKGADINIVENTKKLPVALRRKMEKDGSVNAKGAYDPDTDSIYIFSDNHTDVKDAVRTVLHEAVAHKGTRVVLKDSFDLTMDQVYNNVKNERAFSRVAKDIDTSTTEGKRIAAEEYIASVAEKNETSGVLEKVIAAVRKALRKIGAVKSWSDNDIKELLRRSRSKLGKPASPAASTGEGKVRLRDGDDNLEPEVRLDPLHPTAQRFKIAAAAEEQTKYEPSARERVADTIADTTEAQIPKLLALISRRNLADYAGKRLPALKQYVREASRMDGTRNGLLQDFEKTLNPWNDFVTKNKEQGRKLGQVMHESTLAEVDPSEEYKPLVLPRNMSEADREIDIMRRQKYAILRKSFNALPKEAQDIYTDVRDTYAKQRDNVFNALVENIEESDADGKAKSSLIAELRTKFEAGRTKGPYFPLTRFGDYWAVARDVDGEVISYSRFENPSERKAWIKAFTDLGRGITATGGGKMDEKSMLSRIDPKFVVNVTKLTQALPAELSGPITDEVWQLYLRSMPEMSMRKSFIHRKGRLGFSADALRAYGHHMFHGAHQLAKLKHLPTMERQMDDLREQAAKSEEMGGSEAKWAAPLYREMVKRHDFAKNPQASPLATMATSFGFAWYLGATPAAALTNLTQNAVVAFPHLAAKYGTSKAASAMSTSYREYFGSKGPMSNKLKGDELAAFNEAYKIGLFEHTQAHDLAGIAEEGMRYNSKMRTVMSAVSWMFHKAEESNRQTTFMASYRLNRDAGASHESAIVNAEDDTWDAHFDYTNANRPRVMQSNSAKVVLLFKQYSANMVYRLSRDFNESAKGTFKQLGKRLGLSNADITAHEKIARRRLSGILMMTSLLGGMSALPLKSIVTGIIDTLMGDEDEPFDSDAAFRAYLTATVGEKAQELLFKGAVDAGVGATLSSRVSLNNLLWRSPAAHLEGDELFMHYLGEAVGPVFAVPKDYFTAAKNMKHGHTDRALESMMPKVGKDLLKALRYYDEGALNFRKQEIMGPEQFSAVDIGLQAAGFTPAKLTQQYEQNRAVKNAESKIKRRRTLLMDALFLNQRTGDAEGFGETMEKIKKFNKVNPTIAINASNVVRSARSRNDFEARALGGIAVDPKLHYLHNKYRFAPRPKKKD